MSQRAVATPRLLAVALLTLALVDLGPAWGACSATYNVPGGGPEETDCHAEFGSPALFLNYPPLNPANPKKRRQVRCFDGEPGCDTDGVVNGVCNFPIDVCLRNADPALACIPADVTSVTVDNKPVGSPKYSPELAALQTALNALLPATSCACTSGQALPVALNGDGKRPGRRTVKVSATAGAATDTDRLKLFCVPHGWPSHGYDHANHRASATEATISPANANQLVPAWQWAPGGGFTSTPTVGNGLVYATAWGGSVYALKAKTGALVWQYDAGASLQSSATLTADGRVLVGDSQRRRPLSQREDRRAPLEERRSATRRSTTSGRRRRSPTTASSSASRRTPTTRARSGRSDRARPRHRAPSSGRGRPSPTRSATTTRRSACTSDADCGTRHLRARAAAPASPRRVAVDPTGETVYVNTGRLLHLPVDRRLRLDHSSSTPRPARRCGRPASSRPSSSAPAATTQLDCSPTLGSRAPRPGRAASALPRLRLPERTHCWSTPTTASAARGRSSSRGARTARSTRSTPPTGRPRGRTSCAPTPVTPGFAGFGLFNGAVGYANGRFYAALNDHIPADHARTEASLGVQRGRRVDSSGTTRSAPAGAASAIANGVVFVGANGISKRLRLRRRDRRASDRAGARGVHDVGGVDRRRHGVRRLRPRRTGRGAGLPSALDGLLRRSRRTAGCRRGGGSRPRAARPQRAAHRRPWRNALPDALPRGR